ncbi:MAG: cobamide remodeling phosphodiesterase CbiR [Desulfatirhabdiaceae bacterium]|nr:cobamide remodeling phosphodiesterase CbiR [Desulfatirhabdiaceae bacterium]
MPFLKGSQESFWPFRLSTTSCVIPESILANLLFLGLYLDEVELVFFETRTETNFPSHQDIRDMRKVAEDLDITFNVHLPGDLFFGDPDPALRARFRDTTLRFYERTLPLDPTLYILHLDSRRADGILEPDTCAWSDRVGDSLTAMVKAGLDPSLVAVENLEYPLDKLKPFVERIGLKTCLDIGHLILYGHDLQAQLDRHFSQSAMIHLHGVREGVDHLGVQWISPGDWEMICSHLTDYTGGLSVEIFSIEDLAASLDRLEKTIRKKVATPPFLPRTGSRANGSHISHFGSADPSLS